MNADYKTTHSDIVYRGKLVDILHDTVTLPNGRSAFREVVRHPGGAAVLPIDPGGNLVLIRQYRHPLGGLTLEIPAGMLNPGETHQECATRELEEEIGYRAASVSPLVSISPSPGYLREEIRVFLATELVASAQNLDEEEIIDIETYTLDEAVTKVFDGTITDAKTVAAILAYKAKIK